MLRPDVIYRKKPKNIIPFTAPKGQFATNPEQLSGSVNGTPASDLEERFHKAAKKSGKLVRELFQVTIGGAKGEPGWLTCDYVIETLFGWQAIEVDDVSFIHKGEGERQEALVKDDRRVKGLAEMGIFLIPAKSAREDENPFVAHVTNEVLSTQEDADRWAKENL